MQAHDRGKGLAIEFILNIFGVALAYWVDYAFSFVDNESQFRYYPTYPLPLMSHNTDSTQLPHRLPDCLRSRHPRQHRLPP